MKRLAFLITGLVVSAIGITVFALVTQHLPLDGPLFILSLLAGLTLVVFAFGATLMGLLMCVHALSKEFGK